ncbi:hypothetical protein [Fonticella tunisiensis]|uniref:Uncharacterized protein n=1 Tax=Fonticella tunisiensis TaxID=1096341 RepID=A0A4R7KR69_9CLOT|nr:hypothetical protein [Fonticella tunisiensis]TDT61184.1 hypothetical protein EDD71_10885 [Fonticella tunisiensis]
MKWLYFIMTFIILYAVSLGLYQLIKMFILNKYRINKRIVFVISMVILLLQIIFSNVLSKYVVLQFTFTILFIVFMFTYMELLKRDRIEKNKPVVGRPKPKPGRIKNMNNK